MLTLTTAISRLLRDPLAHFLIVGALIYTAWGMLGEREAQTVSGRQILTVTAGDLEWLEQSFAQQRGRLPRADEFEGLVQHYVRETVLAREALAMGLDENDVVIRRRLAQKLEFLSQDLLQPAEPDEAALRNYFAENIKRYQAPDRVSLSHIYFDPQKRGQATLGDAEALKTEIAIFDSVTVDTAEMGDRFLLQSRFRNATAAELTRQLGSEFAQAVFELESGQWQGPLRSAYGTHLVFVEERVEASPPQFDEVEQAVREDWLQAETDRLNEKFITALMERYDVVIEGQP